MKNRSPLPLALLLVFTATTVSAAADDHYEKQGWTKIRSLDAPAAVAKDPGTETAIPLLAIDQPEITLPHHLVAGEVRFTDVAAPGFIELWTVYAPAERYFSRTLSNFGPMEKLSGSSDWRTVTLPFNGKPDSMPTKLEMNAVLPGGGKLEFRNFALYQSAEISGTGWWQLGTSTKATNALGITIGVIGGLCGILCGLGRARRFVLAMMIGGFSLGILLLVCGAVSVSIGQPLRVYYPLFLFGGVTSLVCGICYPTVRNAYMQRELRAIAAAR